jgi:glycosyltransferase involved in cell wall biosynthesis
LAESRLNAHQPRLAVPASDGSRVRVALITEATYPCHGGGVSTWCDQLIAGLPDIDFAVGALVLNHHATPRFELPSHAALSLFSIWDLTTERLERRGAPSDPEPLPEMHRLVRSIVGRPAQGDDADALDEFAAALRGLVARALTHPLDQQFRIGTLTKAFAAAIRRLPPSETDATLADALQLAEIFSHSLRPLLLRADHCDLVHCSAGGLPLLVGLRANYDSGTPFIFTEHGLYLRERYLSIDLEVDRPLVKQSVMRFFELLTREAYRRAALVAPVSGFNARWAIQMGAPAERVFVLHNGVDPDAFPLRPAEPEAPTLTWLGRIDPIKDLHTLIRSMGHLVDRLPDARLELYGSSTPECKDYHASCETLISKLKLENSITFAGRVEHPADAFHAGQVSALSSISEGFPYAVLESLSCGVPVVGTDVGGVAEAIGEAGLVVPARDSEAFGHACWQVLSCSDTRTEMSLQARRRVEDRFSLGQMIDSHRDLYRALARWEPTVIDLRDSVVAGADNPADAAETAAQEVIDLTAVSAEVGA